MLNKRQVRNDGTFTPSRVKKQKFNPDRDYINQAVEDYLKHGGKIKHPEFDQSIYYNGKFNDPVSADQFLMGM